MKKTLIALSILAGVASAAPVVVTFGNETKPRDFVTDSFYVHGTPANPVNKSTQLPPYQLGTGATITLELTGGKMWAGPGSSNGAIAGTWSNSAAIVAMNSALGLASGFTAADFSENSGIYYTAPGGGNSTSTLTLNLGNTAKIGDKITLFVTAASRQSTTINGFSITGIGSDITLSYAGGNGNGFNSVTSSSVTYNSTDPTMSSNWSSGTGSIQIFRVTGTLASTSLTITQPSTYKNGWQTLSYKTENVPEPATATLSLLALAGLAARRRRKQ